jgi:atypical dual specificity phosphatase
MLTELPYSFRGKIFRSPMPFSRFDRTGVWDAYQEQGVDLVVVLTEPQEYLVYAGRDLPDFYRQQGLESIQIPVPDFGIPPDRQAWELGLQAASQAAREGKKVAVHCLAGIGRTGTFLACLAKQYLGLDGPGAIQWVRQTLPGAMENAYQESYVIDF